MPSEVSPLSKVWGGGGGRKSFSNGESGGGGGRKGFRVVFPQKLDVLTILKGGGGDAKTFLPLKWGMRHFFTLS